MKKEVLKLQERMYDEGMDAYFIPSSDYHASEYMHDFFKLREFVSGFTGSAGDLLITSDAAYLWTDGRYFIQAAEELDGSGIQLMKIGEKDVPTVKAFITELAKDRLSESDTSEFVLGLYGKSQNTEFMLELEDSFIEITEEDDAEPGDGYGRIKIKTDEDLAGSIWDGRPEIIPTVLYELPLSSAGRSAEEKIEDMRAAMKEENADYLLLSDLSETAWLFNLRASDVAYTPVFYSFTLIGADSVSLYIMDEALPNVLPEVLKRVSVRPYESIYEDLENIEDGSVIWMDPKTANYEIYRSVMYTAKTHLATTPAALSKMVKNDIEIKSARNAHVKDGVAVTKFIKWLKDEIKSGKELNEVSAAEHLDGLRAEQDDFIELSFPTISAYAANAAKAHYDAKPETALRIKPEGFYLVDSGGQYVDGTTDITRTIAVGPLTDEMRDNYTYVLKSHIAMARLKVREGMSGKEIDEIVRKPMKDAGLDFNHGIAHGVGHVLSVHEDAAVIRSYQEKDSGLKSGMIMSDEPGLYREGEYGIRTENLVLFKKDEEEFIVNEPLTFAPYDRAAINKSLLTSDEILWVDDYHRRVRDELLPYLNEDERVFLEAETAVL